MWGKKPHSDESCDDVKTKSNKKNHVTEIQWQNHTKVTCTDDQRLTCTNDLLLTCTDDPPTSKIGQLLSHSQARFPVLWIRANWSPSNDDSGIQSERWGWAWVQLLSLFLDYQCFFLRRKTGMVVNSVLFTSAASLVVMLPVLSTQFYELQRHPRCWKQKKHLEAITTSRFFLWMVFARNSPEASLGHVSLGGKWGNIWSSKTVKGMVNLQVQFQLWSA
jgi:hypothetical protein